MIVVVGLSHKTAPIEVRERLAISKDALPDVLRRLLAEPAIGEAIVLSTCNRVEVYAAPRRPQQSAPGRLAPRATALGEELDDTAHAITRVLASIGGDAASAHLVRAQGSAAVRHLFRVAASLDSLVLGEPQILGQLKDAIEAARDNSALGATLGKAALRATRVGKRVRTETALGAGQVSISSVAVDLAQQIFEELADRVTVLVGAGEMAEAAAKLLARAGARLVVVNRSIERGRALANDLGGGAGHAPEARGWGELERSLIEADIVISSTSSPGYVITRDLVKAAFRSRRGRSLFFIDIAVPRDIDPAVNKIDNVFLYDIDDLSQIVAESLEGRAAEATRAEAIVTEEATGFEAWTIERSLTPTIVGLRARTRALLAAEMQRSLSGKLKHLSPQDREALVIMLDAATNKLLHAPVTRLRGLAGDPRAGEYADALCELFGPFDAAEPPKPGPPAELTPPRASDPEIEIREAVFTDDGADAPDDGADAPDSSSLTNAPSGHGAANERANL